jgi:hypothetical protein
MNDAQALDLIVQSDEFRLFVVINLIHLYSHIVGKTLRWQVISNRSWHNSGPSRLLSHIRGKIWRLELWVLNNFDKAHLVEKPLGLLAAGGMD